MSISSMPDSRFTMAIPLPNSIGGQTMGVDTKTLNRGQSVTVINGKTYIFLTIGTGVLNVIRFWSDNPNYYTTNPFDTPHDLVRPGTGALENVYQGRTPKIFSDGSGRLYFSYTHHDGTAFTEERFGICPNPGADILDPTKWYHLDLTTTVATAGGFMTIPSATGVPTLNDMGIGGSLHVRGGYVLSAWQGLSSGVYYTTLALGAIGSSSWSTHEYILAGDGNATVTPSLILEDGPIAFIDPGGYVHMVIHNSHVNISYAVHLQSLTPWALNFPTEFSKKLGPTPGLDTHYEPYKAILDLSIFRWNISPWNVIRSRNLETLSITPDGRFAFSLGNIRYHDQTFNEFGIVTYNITNISDPTRPYNNTPNPWLLADQTYWDNTLAELHSGPFKNNHTSTIIDDSATLVDDAEMLTPSETDPAVYAQPTIIPSRQAIWNEDPNNTGVPITLNLNPGSAMLENQRRVAGATAQSMPRYDSLGFFFFQSDWAGQSVLFNHINTSGIYKKTTMAIFAGSARPLADVHTIWLSEPEMIRPIVFGENNPTDGRQYRYYVTFFGGAPPIPRASNPKVGGNLDIIQAYAEDLV